MNAPWSAPFVAGASASDASGLSAGWRRVAEAVAGVMPVTEVERIWLFRPVRREDREWGTAVIARRTHADRLRVYTASYLMVVRGRERGQGQATVVDVAETPDSVVPDVIRGVQQRAGEEEPPVEIAAASWWENGEHGDDPASPG